MHPHRGLSDRQTTIALLVLHPLFWFTFLPTVRWSHISRAATLGVVVVLVLSTVFVAFYAWFTFRRRPGA